MLQAALSAGLAAEGVDVVDLGVLPTPGVAAVAGRTGVPRRSHLGVAQPVSATTASSCSRAGGRKLSDARGAGGRGRAGPPAGARRRRGPDRPERGRRGSATDWAASAPIPTPGPGTARTWSAALEGRRLDGLRVVIDCANGAAVATAADDPRRPPGPTWWTCWRRPRRHQHQRRLRVHRPLRPGRGGGRRTAPTSAWPSTVTPTGSSPWTRRVPSSTATGSSACSPSTCAAGAGWPATPSSSRS